MSEVDPSMREGGGIEAEALRRRVEELSARLAATEAERGYLASLHEAAVALMGTLEIEPLLQALLRRAAALIGTEHGFLHMVTEDGSHLRVRVAIGLFASYVGHPSFRGEGVSGRVWASGRCLMVEDYDRWEGNPRRVQRSDIHAVLGAPIVRSGEVSGVFSLAYTEPGRRFPPHAEPMMMAFAQLASIAVDNALRVELIEQQARTIQELSAPVVEVGDGILLVPLVGALSEGRAAELMDRLLGAIARRSAGHAILDLTGVEAVDAATAAHLAALVRAARLLGAEGVLTGLRPAVARAMVAEGLDLAGAPTLASVRDGLAHCVRGRAGRGA